MNKELKKQFENIIDEYLKVQEMKSNFAKEIKETEKKRDWKKYNDQCEKMEYLQVLEEVYEKILSKAAKNVILDAMKEESQKAKSKLLKPIRFKVVQDFLKNILESDKIHCYVDSNEYRVEIEFYVVKNQYNNTWINVCLSDLMENAPSWEERFFSIENIEKANFNSLNYNPEEIAKNYINFCKTAKKELEEFKNHWEEMRKAATKNSEFCYMGKYKDGLNEYFYF